MLGSQVAMVLFYRPGFCFCAVPLSLPLRINKQYYNVTPAPLISHMAELTAVMSDKCPLHHRAQVFPLALGLPHPGPL